MASRTLASPNCDAYSDEEASGIAHIVARAQTNASGLPTGRMSSANMISTVLWTTRLWVRSSSICRPFRKSALRSRIGPVQFGTTNSDQFSCTTKSREYHFQSISILIATNQRLSKCYSDSYQYSICHFSDWIL